MIKEQLENNENVKPNTKLLNQLKENFPDFFDKDNNFKIDKFKNALKSDEINITKEGYELNFLGKSYARFQTSTETLQRINNNYTTTIKMKIKILRIYISSVII